MHHNDRHAQEFTDDDGDDDDVDDNDDVDDDENDVDDDEDMMIMTKTTTTTTTTTMMVILCECCFVACLSMYLCHTSAAVWVNTTDDVMFQYSQSMHEDDRSLRSPISECGIEFHSRLGGGNLRRTITNGIHNVGACEEFRPATARK